MAIKYAPFIMGELEQFVREKYPEEIDTSSWRWRAFPGVKGEWRDIEPFEAELTYDGSRYNSSSITYLWKDENGHRWPMSQGEFEFLLENGKLSSMNGKTVSHGVWIIVKKGTSYGIKREADIV